MSVCQIPIISRYIIGFIGGIFLLPCVVTTARFTQLPPSVLYVSSGRTARFMWDYHVDDRGGEFQPNSPVWSFIDKVGNGRAIGSDDKYTSNWSFVINRATCPARLLNPNRVSRESTATLVITDVTTADNGIYQCSLKFKAGNPISHQVQLVVTVSPQFNPKPSKVKNITEGQDLNVPCTAVGPPTPNITWVQGHVTKSKGKGSATLRIPSIKRDQNGTYECQASNNLNENPVSTQTVVVVYYQPSVMLGILKNRTINESDSLSIKCDADGYPPPTIKWKTPTGSVHTGNVYNIPSVSRSHAGTYTCTASNGIGREAMASIQVTVQFKPIIDESQSFSQTSSWNGNSVRLRCFATGLPAPRITWYKPKNQQITTGVNILPGGSEATVLTTSDQGDYGQYKCQAINILGTDEHIINITQLFPPGLVTVSVTELEASSFTVRWTKPADDGGLAVTGYLLEVSTKPPVIIVNTHDVITGLRANTQYTVKVYPKNIVGYGAASVKAIRTKTKGKPSIPQLLAALLQRKDSKLSVVLRWSIPDDNGGNITHYTIYVKEVKQKADWIKNNDVNDPHQVGYRVTKNIVYGKTYMFMVTAWNEYGESVKDEEGAKTVNTTADEETATSAMKYCIEEESKLCLGSAVLGVFIAILVLSLGFHLLQFLYLKRRVTQLKSRKGRPVQKRKTKKEASPGESYENDLELEDKITSAVTTSHATRPVQTGPEYETIQQRNPNEAGSSNDTSNYQGLNLSIQGTHGPVYEPLRTRPVEPSMQHNDNEQHPYEPLNIKNENTTYQSLQGNNRESVI